MLRITRFFQKLLCFLRCPSSSAPILTYSGWNKSNIYAEIDCTKFRPGKQNQILHLCAIFWLKLQMPWIWIFFFFFITENNFSEENFHALQNHHSTHSIWYIYTAIQTYSLIPSRSLKSRLSSLRSKNPLLLVKTRCLGLWPLRMLFSWMWVWSLHSAWKPSCTHASSCLGLNPQQLGSNRLWI